MASANGTQNNMNISKANKSSGESAIFNFLGQNSEWNGLIVFHSGAVDRKIPEIHTGIFGRMVSAHSH